MNDALQRLDNDADNASAIEDFTMSPEELVKLRQELAESKALVDKHQETIQALNRDKESLLAKRTDLERRLTALETEYEELLDKTIADEEQDAQRNTDMEDTIAELKVKKKE